VAPTYGLTEAASQVATMTPRDAMRKPGSVGKPLMFTQIRIADERGATMPPHQVGEIVIRGPTVMRGYFQNAEATRQVLQSGELHTADLGYMDDDGDLWLVQRRSDLIVTGGENVYPAEVERILRRHPAVEDVVVVGLPDAVWGQRVAAAVVLKPGQQISAAELDAHARTMLAGYKLPREICFVQRLPVLSNGKLDRATVREFFT
jgi:O-succinylbenzoic acid--CoA ligase